MNYWIKNDIIPDLDQSDKDWLIEKFDGRLNPNADLFITWENELPTSITEKFTTIGEKLDLQLVETSVFTGTPGKKPIPHVDHKQGYDTLRWRLSYFVQGGCPFYWWESGEIVRIGSYAEWQNETTVLDVLDTTEVKSAFVRTDIPHSVDMTNNTKTRIVVTGTYTYVGVGGVSLGGVPPWEYITNRLMSE